MKWFYDFRLEGDGFPIEVGSARNMDLQCSTGSAREEGLAWINKTLPGISEDWNFP